MYHLLLPYTCTWKVGCACHDYFLDEKPVRHRNGEREAATERTHAGYLPDFIIAVLPRGSHTLTSTATS